MQRASQAHAASSGSVDGIARNVRLRSRFRFAVRLTAWAAFYVSSLSAYNHTYSYVGAIAVHYAQIRPAAVLIRWTLPGESVRAEGDSIISKTCRVQLLRGCDGVEAWLLLASAMLVFPLPWRKRALGAAVGAALVSGLNLVRIVTLFHVARIRPDWFEVAHGLVWQTLMIVAVGWFVWMWSREDDARPAAPEARRA
jgi:exosortase family protein XrtM